MRPGHLVILAALAAAALLVGVELQKGALADGRLAVESPCAEPAPAVRDGADAQTQRIALAAVSEAACRLGVGREALLLQVAGAVEDGDELPGEVEDALRTGLGHAIDAEEDQGRLNRVTAFLLGQTIGHAPVDWIVAAVKEIGPRVT